MIATPDVHPAKPESSARLAQEPDQAGIELTGEPRVDKHELVATRARAVAHGTFHVATIVDANTACATGCSSLKSDSSSNGRTIFHTLSAV